MMSKIKVLPNINLPNKKERHKLFGSVDPGPKTKPTNKEHMADLQNSQKDFLFEINAVGISNVKYPIVVKSTLNPSIQTTIGNFTLTANVDRMSKGTNMSRFLEEIEQSNDNGFQIDFQSLTTFAKNLKKRLKQENVQVEVSFPWFFERLGPSSEKRGLNHADVTLKMKYIDEEHVEFQASLSALITTLCPCSKEISEYSAHSQRGRVTMDVCFTDDYSDTTIDW